MDFFNSVFVFDSLIILRVAASIFYGFLLGFEREITGKFAGLRTHILVCVGSAVFTLLSIYGFKFITATGAVGINDPARIAAQIITGIGFIGAGTVMRQGTSISGITTAATLWVSASVGMACGCGMFFLGGVATVSTLIVLISIRHFERKFLLSRISSLKHFEIALECPIERIDEIYKIIETNFATVVKIKKKIRQGKDFSMKVQVATKKTISKINDVFQSGANINSLEISEIHE